MDALSQWSLHDLIDRVLKEHLVDECVVEEEYVIIVQGSTRFVLDHHRAHAFLRGIVRGMSPAFRWKSATSRRKPNLPAGLSDSDGEQSGLFDAFRQHLVRKWWDRYENAGCPLGRSVSGLVAWVRYDTWVTTN